jgi:SAM-dependent methyltransferase
MDNNAAEFVRSIPDLYDRGLGPVIFSDYAADMAQRVAATHPARILETAAGTGIVTRALLDAVPDAAVTVTDLNDDMLDIARQKLGAGDRAIVQTADAQQLPFADASFETIVCQFGIMFYPDRPKSYAEASRVLVPGGRYFFSVWDTHAHNAFARVTDGVLHKIFADNPPPFYRVPFSCGPIDPIKDALQVAGFSDIVVEVMTRRKVVADLPLFVRGLIYGNPVIDQIRARASVTPEAAYEQALTALTAEFGQNPSVTSLQAIFYTARKPVT